MRIVSNFHDYYDPAQSLGQDLSLVWVRKPFTRVASPWPFPRPPAWGEVFRSFRVRAGAVGFCGRLWPVIKIKKNQHGAELEKATLAYSAEEVDEFLMSAFSPKETAPYWKHGKKWCRGAGSWPWRFHQDDVRRYYLEWDAHRDTHQELFVGAGSPVFVATYEGRRRKSPVADEEGDLNYNAALAPWGFYRQKDVYTAFQEIAQYYGGVLAHPGRPIPEVPDDVLAQAKGFDKWSFRKPPENEP